MNHPGRLDSSRGNSSLSLGDRVRSLRLPDRAVNGRGRGAALPWATCVILLGMTGAFGYRAYRLTPAAPVSAPEPAAAPTASPAVTNALAGSGEVALQVKGYLIPAHQVQVSPKIGGMIVDIDESFKEGQFFPKDKVLARLEDVDYRAERDRAVAALAAAKQRRNELKGYRPEEIKQAEMELEEYRSTLQQMKRELVRSERLTGTNALAQREFEQAKFGHDSMARRVSRLELALELMKQGPRKEKLEAAEAEVRAAQADLEKCEWRLRNCEIRAPIAGTILTRKAEKGNVVNPLAFNVAASLCDMADLSDLEVDLTVQERDVSAIFEGQGCTIMPEAFQNYEPFRQRHPRGYDGYVSRLMPIADRAKGAIPVRVKVVLPEEEVARYLQKTQDANCEVGRYLKPDMSVLVSFFKTSPASAEKTPAAGRSSGGR
jgi:HlyD family secretion protein